MDKTARLIGEVAARYGIRLDPDDPAFALVALNQLALEDAVEQLAARMKRIAAELERFVQSVRPYEAWQLGADEGLRRVQGMASRVMGKVQRTLRSR